MKYCLLVVYCSTYVANAAQLPRSLSGNLDFFWLPHSRSNEGPPPATSIRSRLSSQKQWKIRHENILSKRGVPSRSGSPPKENLSNPVDTNRNSGFAAPPGQKGDRSLNVKQKRPLDPSAGLNRVAELESGHAVPLISKTPRRGSAKLVTGSFKEGRNPDGPDPSPPADGPGMRRSRTPPARADVAAKGPAIAYTRSPAMGTQYFAGNTETWSNKEISHSQQASAGGHMFRPAELGRNPLHDLMVVRARGKNIRVQITPHVGGYGHYQTSTGLEDHIVGRRLGQGLSLQAGNYRPGQTTSIEARLYGPGTVDATADNHSSRVLE